MIDVLTKFFESYPRSFLDTNSPFEGGISPELMSRMLEFRDRQLHILSYAQHYRIDQETVQMLTDLAYETKPAGREEIYREAQFPFPALLVECPDTTGEGSYVALTTVADDCMYTQRMLVSANGIVPSLLVLKSSGLKGELIWTPTYEAAMLGPKNPDGDAALKAESEVCSHFVAIVATMCSMLKYKGMIETDEVQAFSRPERRRAEKAGKSLLGKRVSLAALNQNLAEIPGVNDGVFFFPEDVAPDASDDTHPSRRLAALYVSATLSPQEVLNALRARLDPVFLPRPIFRVAQLPRNTNGKLPAAAVAGLYARCKSERLAGLPASGRIRYFAVPDSHPSIPGHFPGEPIVPGVVILARVEEAIRADFPHLELGVLLSARFHTLLRPGQGFRVRPQMQDEHVRFEARLAAPSTDSQSVEGAVIVSGRWAVITPAGQEPTRP